MIILYWCNVSKDLKTFTVSCVTIYIGQSV